MPLMVTLDIRHCKFQLYWFETIVFIWFAVTPNNVVHAGIVRMYRMHSNKIAPGKSIRNYRVVSARSCAARCRWNKTCKGKVGCAPGHLLFIYKF